MAKQQLKRYGWLQRNIQMLDEKVQELKAAAEKITTTISDGSKRGSSERDKMASIIAALVEVEKVLKVQLEQSYVILEEIEEAISNLPEREQYLIRARYVDGRSWEEIYKDMNYSENYIYKLHSSALRMLGPKKS